MGGKQLENESSSYEQSFSQSQSNLSLNIKDKRKAIKKKNSRKKDYMFCHTVCIAVKGANGQYQMITHQKYKTMNTKSTNIYNMSNDYANKINREIMTNYEVKKQSEIEAIKQRKQSTECNYAYKENSSTNSPVQVYPYAIPAFYGFSYIPVRYQ